MVGLHFAGVYGKENSAVGVATLLELVAAGFRPRSAARPPGRRDPGARRPPTAGTRRPSSPTGPATTPRSSAPASRPPGPGSPTRWSPTSPGPSDETPEQPGELRYTHFGVRFSASRRQPLMTAVNIDGASLVQIKRSNDRQW